MQDRFEELKNNLLPRFWDTASNDMLYPNEISTEEGDFRYLLPFMGQKNEIFYTLSEMLINPRFIPMKPTGLKDKNGKLIYESDILNCANGSINGIIMFDTMVVEWLGFKFCPSYFTNIKGEDCSDSTHWVEIIGNIHSNPELVEVQK